MAKGSMKNIWLDRKMQDERLQKLTARKKTAGAATTEAGAESSAEPKPEDKQ
jgi:hypothetical protein